MLHNSLNLIGKEENEQIVKQIKRHSQTAEGNRKFSQSAGVSFECFFLLKKNFKATSINLLRGKCFLVPRKTHILTLSLFAEPVTEIIGGADLFINKGSTINLTCIVRYAPEPPPSMVWSHNREVSVNKFTIYRLDWNDCRTWRQIVVWFDLNLFENLLLGFKHS